MLRAFAHVDAHELARFDAVFEKLEGQGFYSFQQKPPSQYDPMTFLEVLHKGQPVWILQALALDMEKKIHTLVSELR